MVSCTDETTSDYLMLDLLDVLVGCYSVVMTYKMNDI